MLYFFLMAKFNLINKLVTCFLLTSVANLTPGASYHCSASLTFGYR